jgi:hypothetical protein
MKHIQKFESFDLTQSEDNLQNKNCSHYSCDECDNIWKSDEECDCCKFCDSNEIEELHEDEWNELNKMRLENN